MTLLLGWRYSHYASSVRQLLTLALLFLLHPLTLFCITLIPFNVTFEMHHYFLHRRCLFLSQGLVKVTSLEPISEGPCEYLLIGIDDLDGFLVKTGQIFSKRLVLPLATLKRLVVYNFLCLLVKNWCIIFPPDLGKLVMESWRRLVYQLRAASFSVCAINLHFSELVAPIMVI